MNKVTYIKADLLAINDPAGLLDPVDEHGIFNFKHVPKADKRRRKPGSSLAKAMAVLSSGERG